VSHRLQIRDGDLDPLQNPGAVYLAEQYTLAHDDANHMNSLAREPLVVSGAPGGSWNLDLTASASVNGPAIFAWAGATSVFLQTEPANDGRCILSAKATDLGNGRWHYEYALYNHDMDRGVRGFSVRVDDAAITNVGFHAPFSHDEAFHNNPWEGGVADGLLWWTTDAYNVLNHSNPVRWGTLYNFRFDADRPPVASRVVLHLYKPGAPAYLSGTILGPAAACPADFNADGLVDFFDYDDFVACFELPDCAAGDFNADGSVDFFDYDDFVAAFEGGC
jgi:hypothetical protein